MRSRRDPMTPYQERLGRFTVQWMTGYNNVMYRLSAGRVAGQSPTGAPICLLTTTGRKTGRARTVPLLYLPEGENLFVVASKGGMSTHPAWYLNLVADPNVTVEAHGRTFPAVARLATDEERRTDVAPAGERVRALRLVPDANDAGHPTDRPHAGLGLIGLAGESDLDIPASTASAPRKRRSFSGSGP